MLFEDRGAATIASPAFAPVARLSAGSRPLPSPPMLDGAVIMEAPPVAAHHGALEGLASAPARESSSLFAPLAPPSVFAPTAAAGAARRARHSSEEISARHSTDEIRDKVYTLERSMMAASEPPSIPDYMPPPRPMRRSLSDPSLASPEPGSGGGRHAAGAHGGTPSTNGGVPRRHSDE